MNFKIKHKKLLALLFFTTFLFYGCTSNEISEKQLEIDNLKEEVNRLSDELKETKEKLENISIDDVLLRDKLKIEDEFSWMRNTLFILKNQKTICLLVSLNLLHHANHIVKLQRH